MNKIVEKVKEIITKNNLNIAKLSVKIGVPRETLSRVINGSREAGEEVTSKLNLFLQEYENGMDLQKYVKPKKLSKPVYELRENEIWINGYVGRYAVSTEGQIYSVRSGRYLDGFKNTGGYKKVEIGGKQIYWHRVVAESFIPNPENKQEVNHIDFNKNNNAVSNLEWVTGSENMEHYWKSKHKVS